MGLSSDFKLSFDDIEELEALRLEARESRELALMKRVRAILLVGRDGRRRQEAAEICEASVRAVFLWQESYRKHGVEGLRTGVHTGRPSRLSPDELEALASLIEGGPEAAGLDSGRWTSAMVCNEIFTRFGVRYSTSRVRRILHQLGFSVQYPKKNWQRQTSQPRSGG